MNKKIITGILVLFILLFSALPLAMAEDNTSGKTPLVLEESVPTDDAYGVATDATITLTFSKNIVNMSVAENNISQFVLRENGKDEVAIEVFLADDQVNREKRNDALITPVEPLKEDTDYELTVSKELSSKSGVTLAEDLVIHFSTKEEESGLFSVSAGTIVLAAVAVLAVLRRRKKA